jgi:hypothetical protein
MDFPEETWTAELEPDPPLAPPTRPGVQGPQWVAPLPDPEPAGPLSKQLNAEPPKAKGFLRGFQNMSKQIKKTTNKVVTKIKGKSDPNNNDGDGHSRFYVDFGLEEFHVANISTTCW